MRILNGDVGLNVVVEGADDAPPILLLHGILSSARTWDWMVPRLSDRYRVIRLDFRGHGDSDRAAGRYHLEHYVSDAAAACEQVAGRPCVVIGHSLGGATAAGLAQTHPDLVRGLVLEDAPLSQPDPAAEGADRNSLLDSFAVLRRLIPQVQAAGRSVEEVAAASASAPSAAGPTFGEVLHEDGLTTMAAGTLAVDASVLDPVLDGTMGQVFDASRSLGTAVAAVAADPASPDAVTRPADLARLIEVNPEVSTHTLAGANHLIHDTMGQRERFWTIVETFLASLGT
jgi:pimeloyl-ACP methyl ester carboxylesterase